MSFLSVFINKRLNAGGALISCVSGNHKITQIQFFAIRANKKS